MVTAPFRSRLAFPATLGILMLLGVAPAWTQQADRERAQMLQMQQQLQRLQSDNAAVQKERGELQSKALEAEKAQKQSSQELARTRQTAAALEKEKAGLHNDLAAANGNLTTALAQIEFLKKDIAKRDETIREGANEKRHLYAELGLLLSRLKVQTGRADLCETRHDGVMKFTASLIDRYESERLRLCEPITGIWKVRNEMQVQQFRAELYEYRLDIPLPQPTAPASAAVNASPAPAPAPAPVQGSAPVATPAATTIETAASSVSNATPRATAVTTAETAVGKAAETPVPDSAGAAVPSSTALH